MVAPHLQTALERFRMDRFTERLIDTLQDEVDWLRAVARTSSDAIIIRGAESRATKIRAALAKRPSPRFQARRHPKPGASTNGEDG